MRLISCWGAAYELGPVKNVLKALSAVHGVDALTLEQRLLILDWAPTRDHYDALVDPAASSGNGVGPYPFFWRLVT